MKAWQLVWRGVYTLVADPLEMVLALATDLHPPRWAERFSDFCWDQGWPDCKVPPGLDLDLEDLEP